MTGFIRPALPAAAATALLAMMIVQRLLPTAPRLRDRVDPYLRGSAHGNAPVVSPSRLSTRTLAIAVGRFVEGSPDRTLDRKLRQAAVLMDVPGSQRRDVYRSRVTLTAAAGAGLAISLAALLKQGPVPGIGFVALGAVAGASLWRGRLDRTIDRRRARMRIELYTINQLLAMHIRAGSGVVAAVTRLVERGRGEVVAELRAALRWHRGGAPAAGAFRRAAEITPEPHARRTYQALATADERGSDVARALLALSEDVREGRRDGIRRRATRRRALMLIPILGVLAPILILFVAAPIPWLVLHGFG